MTTTPRCDRCRHSMLSDDHDQLYCIEGPPTPLIIHVIVKGKVAERMQCHFPLLSPWAKCSRFSPGETQIMNERD